MSLFVGVRVPDDLAKRLIAYGGNRSAVMVEALRRFMDLPATETVMKRTTARTKAEPAKAAKMIMPKVETPKPAEARPAHAETCRCGICQLRRK